MAAFINAIRESKDLMAACAYLQKYWDAYMEMRAQRITILSALKAEAALVDKAQLYCQEYLKPDGNIKQIDEFAGKILALFDGPEQRSALEKRCEAYATREPV